MKGKNENRLKETLDKNGNRQKKTNDIGIGKI